jgi:polyphosphate glucokinase
MAKKQKPRSSEAEPVAAPAPADAAGESGEMTAPAAAETEPAAPPEIEPAAPAEIEPAAPAEAVPASPSEGSGEAPTGGVDKREAGAQALPRTLCIDIGGSGIKMLVVDSRGEVLTERTRLPTPTPATPKKVLPIVRDLVDAHGEFERVSVGFPGVVTDGTVKTAPNLADKKWRGFDLQGALERDLGRPVRVANDADVQGLGVVEGRGVEMVITLGTGMGSALFVEGRLVPNLELGHHPFRRGKTYEQRLGRDGLHKAGRKKWNKRLLRAIAQWDRTFNFRRLYLGGGHAKLVKRKKLPDQVVRVKNIAGLLGGIRLWE